MPLAPQKRAWANGRSMLTVSTATLAGSRAASSLKRFVCASHTGVSREGTTLSTSVLPAKSCSVTSRRPSGPRWWSLKSGARSPAWSSGPATGRGLPRIFTVRPAIGVSSLSESAASAPRGVAAWGTAIALIVHRRRRRSGPLLPSRPVEIAIAEGVEAGLQRARPRLGHRASSASGLLGGPQAPLGQIRVLAGEPVLHGDPVDQILEGG